MPDLASVLEQARVPEHSAPFMQAMSQGTAFLEGEYLFLTADDWLMAIGYPLSGEYAHDSFERALAAALRRVPKRLEGVDCWAIGPDLPARLAGHVTDRDTFYILPCDAPVPARLRRPVEIAAEKLTVREGRDFTPAHRRLWAEFMNRAVLPPNVRGLFARTGAVLDTPGLRLLDAVDAEGNLAASLLLDDAPRRFCSYLIGAHSRTHYTPHAADLLFAHMLRSAREADKEYVHLGLGVNDGIRRFKTKWGGRPALPYVMASWRETPRETGSETISSLVRILLESPSDLSKRQIFDSLPQQRPFAMLWELTKNGRTSWIGGTAHFFCYSFEAAFRNLFERVDTVLFEGPLDADSLDEVARIGKTPDGRHPPLICLRSRKSGCSNGSCRAPPESSPASSTRRTPTPPTCGGCSQPPGTGMHSSRCGRRISNGWAGTSPWISARGTPRSKWANPSSAWKALKNRWRPWSPFPSDG